MKKITAILFSLMTATAYADGKITNADIYSGAAINFTKMQALTASRVACLSGSGFITPCTMPSAYLDATSSIQTQLDAKQATGNYITALTGDITASGPGSAAATLATVNSNVGTFTNSTITVNAKGLITAASNGSGGSTSSVTKSIAQTSHGFSVGNILGYNGTAYILAKADNDANSEVYGIVSAVADANNFTLTTDGYVTGLSGLTTDRAYFLSAATAGLMSLTEPSVVGQVSKPVFLSDSTTSGYFIQFRGLVVSSGGGSGGFGAVTQYTQTVNTVNGNAAKTGTPTFDAATYQAIGKRVMITWTYQQTSGGTAGTGAYVFLLPNSFTVDTSVMQCGNQFGSKIGTFKVSDVNDAQSATTNGGDVICYDSTHYALMIQSASDVQFRMDGGGTQNFGQTNFYLSVEINGLIVN